MRSTWIAFTICARAQWQSLKHLHSQQTKKSQKDQYSHPKSIPEPILLHCCISFPSTPLLSLWSQEVKIHKNYHCLHGNFSQCPKKSLMQNPGCRNAFGYSPEATFSNKIMGLQHCRKLLLVQSLGLIKTYPINIKKFTHETFLLPSWNLKFYSRCLKSCIIYKISAIHSGAINPVLCNKESLHFKGFF